MSNPPSSDDTDAAVAAGSGAIDRSRSRRVVQTQRRPRRGQPSGLKTRLALVAAVNLVLLVIAGVIGAAVVPLGMFGALAVLTVMIALTLLILFAPSTPVPSVARLHRAELKALPAQTARWLEAQRPQLPAPAFALIDRLEDRLDALTPQLASLDEDAPAALEVRRLVGEQLPAFVKDYARVPGALRSTARNGRTPNQQLVEGLELIEREIGTMSEQLAQGDLDSLETRGRYLEIRYRRD